MQGGGFAPGQRFREGAKLCRWGERLAACCEPFFFFFRRMFGWTSALFFSLYYASYRDTFLVLRFPKLFASGA